MNHALVAFLFSSLLAMAFSGTVKSCNRATANDVSLIKVMLAPGLRDLMVGFTGVSGWRTLDESLPAGIAEPPELSARCPIREAFAGAEPDFYFAGRTQRMAIGGEVTPETLEPLGVKTCELTENCIRTGTIPSSSMDDMCVVILNLAASLG